MELGSIAILDINTEVYCRASNCRFRSNENEYNKCFQPDVNDHFRPKYPGQRVFTNGCNNCEYCQKCNDCCEYKEYIVQK